QPWIHQVENIYLNTNENDRKSQLPETRDYRYARLMMQRRYAHVQVRRGYLDFVFEFDRLQPSDVIWEPYTEEAVAARAPLGLSSLCTRDQAYWLTILPMVFDIFVEPHCPQRVMRQFGLRQVFPGNVQFL
ncbi:hypothetical protein ACOICX_27155, partial [Klebsiella pneumoniae]|uniref:hypothetical protein n=1 Tax=Klebsiella pneumoniae TaxID=573 RepID=UPI003B597DEA